MQRNGESGPFLHWRETHESSGEARTVYRPLLERLDALPRTQIRALDERLEATMREMGVTFDIARERPWGHPVGHEGCPAADVGLGNPLRHARQHP